MTEPESEIVIGRCQLFGELLESFRCPQDTAGLTEQMLAGISQFDTARRPFEQRHTQFCFQLTDPLRQWRGRHMQPVGRTPEMPFLRDCNEVPQSAQIDIAHTSQTSRQLLSNET